MTDCLRAREESVYMMTMLVEGACGIQDKFLSCLVYTTTTSQYIRTTWLARLVTM